MAWSSWLPNPRSVLDCRLLRRIFVEEMFHSPRLVRFGTFEVDVDAGELRKSGVKLKLTGQPFQVLSILLERPGEVVTREELQKRLWPDTFVDVDHNLNTAINKIREVLGDSAESPRFVETLPRRGYRFIAATQGAAPAPGQGQSPPMPPARAAEVGFWHRSFAMIVLVSSCSRVAWRCSLYGDVLRPSRRRPSTRRSQTLPTRPWRPVCRRMGEW